MNTVKKLKKNLTIASLVITLVATQHSDARNLSDYTTLEKAQFATSILRAPCGIAHNFTSKTHTSGKIAKLLVNAVRLSDNILAMINANENKAIYRSGWAVFEAFNIGSSFVELTHDMPELEIDAQTERSIMNYLNQAQKVLLPCAESAAAVMSAYYNNNGNETPQDKINIHRYQSLISLSRALSEFLESEKDSNSVKIWAAIVVANTLSSVYHWTTEIAPVPFVVQQHLNNLNAGIIRQQAILNSGNSEQIRNILARRNGTIDRLNTNEENFQSIIEEINLQLNGQHPLDAPEPFLRNLLAHTQEQLMMHQALGQRMRELAPENARYARSLVQEEIQNQPVQNAALNNNEIHFDQNNQTDMLDCIICTNTFSDLENQNHLVRLCSNNHIIDQECYTTLIAISARNPVRCPLCRVNVNNPQFYTLTNNHNQQGN